MRWHFANGECIRILTVTSGVPTSKVRDAQTACAMGDCQRAVLALPLVAKELLANSHPEPERTAPGTYTIGGRTVEPRPTPARDFTELI